MATPLFDSLNSNQNGTIFDVFGGPQQFQSRLNTFAQQFMQTNNCSPEEKVRQLLNSGQMSQAQFNQLRMIANRITGKNL